MSLRRVPERGVSSCRDLSTAVSIVFRSSGSDPSVSGSGWVVTSWLRSLSSLGSTISSGDLAHWFSSFLRIDSSLVDRKARRYSVDRFSLASDASHSPRVSFGWFCTRLRRYRPSSSTVINSRNGRAPLFLLLALRLLTFDRATSVSDDDFSIRRPVRCLFNYQVSNMLSFTFNKTAQKSHEFYYKYGEFKTMQ